MNDVDGVVLAGGQSRRMGGGDKSECQIAGRSMIEWVIGTVRPQVNRLIISSNSPPERFTALGIPVVADQASGFKGPLMGLYSAMRWLASEESFGASPQWLALFSCDTPFLPANAVVSLKSAALSEGVSAALVTLDGEPQPTLSLWHFELLPQLQEAVEKQGVAGFKHFLESVNHTSVELGQEWRQRLINVNSPEELERARQMAQEL